jgi:tRNA(adenine34) deaminase
VNDFDFMGLALAEARQAAEEGEVPIGAVLVLAGEVVARAHNRRETDKDATAHAEMIVIRESCRKLSRWRLSGATLYVTIEPCPMCAGALVMSRIDRLVYGSPDSKAGAVESIFNIVQHPALNHRLDVTAGIRREECAAAMQAFFRGRRCSNARNADDSA